MILKCLVTGQDYHRVIAEYCLDCHAHFPPPYSIKMGLDRNTLWHPHTDPPGEAENAVIACDKWSGELYLVGIAESRNGQWCSEEWGEPIKPPFWWADEAELIALIPK